MLNKKNVVLHFLSLCVLCIGFVLCRYVCFDIHGMKQFPVLLFGIGLVSVAISFLLKGKATSVCTALAYIVGFIAAVIFKTDGVDAGGAATNNLWVIWLLVFLCLVLAGAIGDRVIRSNKKRIMYLLLPVLTLILEILPYGAVCIFAISPTETMKETFSYFDLIPFGYANFAPLLTAISTCLIFALLLIFCIKGNVRIAVAAKNLLYAAIVMSLGPLIFGMEYYSLVAGLITLSLVGELLLLQFAIKRLSTNK